jgi:hypothetical protein
MRDKTEVVGISKQSEGVCLLTVYMRIQLRLDLQVDKSSVLAKGPSSLMCEPKVSNLWNKCVMQEPIY